MCCTGAADGSLKVWDKRKLGADGGSALFTFAHHTGAVLRAEWSPSHPGRPSLRLYSCRLTTVRYVLCVAFAAGHDMIHDTSLPQCIC